MATYARGLAVGKFCPPHRGHMHLIETACRQAEQVQVIVCSRPEDAVPAPVRACWLRELFPSIRVLAIDDVYDADDSALWAGLTLEWLGYRPDAVFTSEDYGTAYARELGCAHVCVDRQRVAVPCSATAIRADPFAQWEFLPAPARAWYACRVCVLGAESTGTTTLAQALAVRLDTAWVLEYGREYSEQKLLRGESDWTSEEFVAIAREQNRREELAAREANRVLVCDTDSFATNLWHRRYIGTDSDEVARLAASRHVQLYLLTGDEIPFAQDGLRDGEHIRHEMHRWFIEALERQSVPWRLVSGTPARRLEDALLAVGALFQASQWSPKA